MKRVQISISYNPTLLFGGWPGHIDVQASQERFTELVSDYVWHHFHDYDLSLKFDHGLLTWLSVQVEDSDTAEEHQDIVETGIENLKNDYFWVAKQDGTLPEEEDASEVSERFEVA